MKLSKILAMLACGALAPAAIAQYLSPHMGGPLELKEVAKTRIERSVPSPHTFCETFDVGVDHGAPVAMDYFEPAPFKFNGKIEKIHIKYTD